MKKINWNLKLYIAIIAVFGLSHNIMAQPHRRGPEPQESMTFRSGLPYLDLSEEQRDQIKQIHYDYLKDVQPLKDEVRINRAKINALLHQDDPDMQQIVSLVEADGKLLTQIQVKTIEHSINVRNLLTEEQKVIYDEHREKAGERRALAEHHWRGYPPQRSRF
jgi:Spy/CpxP family protein refolding chaperone